MTGDTIYPEAERHRDGYRFQIGGTIIGGGAVSLESARDQARAWLRAHGEGTAVIFKSTEVAIETIRYEDIK